MTVFPEINASWPLLAAVAAASYLFGSIAFGVLVSRAMNLGDIRRIGSGNIGATNVLRTGSKPAAAATLVCDMAKGALPVIAARELVGADAAQFAAVAAFLGHLFPIWFGFKGGKGVATFIGILLALSFAAGAAVCAVWLATAAVARISSVAALVSVATAPLWLAALGQGTDIATVLILVLMVWARHSQNIARLLSGQEPKIRLKTRDD